MGEANGAIFRLFPPASHPTTHFMETSIWHFLQQNPFQAQETIPPSISPPSSFLLLLSSNQLFSNHRSRCITFHLWYVSSPQPQERSRRTRDTPEILLWNMVLLSTGVTR